MLSGSRFRGCCRRTMGGVGIRSVTPAGRGRHHLPVSDRDPVAGPACDRSSGRGRRCGSGHRRYAADGTWDRVLAAAVDRRPTPPVGSHWTVIGGCDDQPGASARDEHDPPGAGHRGLGRITRNLPLAECEPAGHGIGRSRGGLTTKIHHRRRRQRVRPLAVVDHRWATQRRRDAGRVLAEIVVPRRGRGPCRGPHPDAVIADRAYSSGVTRDDAPSLGDHRGHPAENRRDRRPPRTRAARAADHRRSTTDPLPAAATSSNDHSPCSNNGADSPPATTSSPSPTAPPSSSARASPGYAI